LFYHPARLVEMIGYLTGSMRQFNQTSVYAFINQRFHGAPKGHGHAGLHESVFASPKGEKRDARGAERLAHKEERQSACLRRRGAVNPRSPEECPKRSAEPGFVRRALEL
jgi:hypothetical protein